VLLAAPRRLLLRFVERDVLREVEDFFAPPLALAPRELAALRPPRFAAVLRPRAAPPVFLREVEDDALLRVPVFDLRAPVLLRALLALRPPLDLLLPRVDFLVVVAIECSSCWPHALLL
jgi:hypothetical protein